LARFFTQLGILKIRGFESSRPHTKLAEASFFLVENFLTRKALFDNPENQGTPRHRFDFTAAGVTFTAVFVIQAGRECNKHGRP
jgi:hypothetical protein